jgi:hypothetical protein
MPAGEGNQLVISDAHGGLKGVARKILPDAWQWANTSEFFT